MKRLLIILAALLLLNTAVVLYRNHLHPLAGQTGKTVYVAVAAPLSGPERVSGQAMINGIRLALEDLKRQKRLSHVDIRLIIKDDGQGLRAARNTASAIASDNKALIVLGHLSSANSQVAGRIYRKNGIPAITASAAADNVTDHNSLYFRIIPGNRFTGAFIAYFAGYTLNFDSASIVCADDIYGRTLTKSFIEEAKRQGITIKGNWVFDPEDTLLSRKLETISARLRATDDPGIIFCATRAKEGAKLISNLKYPGSDYTVIGPPAFATETFRTALAQYPNERIMPGYHSDNVYAASPYSNDLSGFADQKFEQRYKRKYGCIPSWIAACYYDAVLVTAKAIETADIHGKDISANRQRLLNALKRLNHSELAVPGLSGNIHFDENGGAVGTLAMSIYRHGRLIPAYTQYCYLPQASAMPQASPSSAPKLINIDGRTLIRKQIVFVGLDMIDMRNFRFSSLSADLDFYLWFRFKEYFDPISIRFPTATEPDCLKRPVLSSRFNDTDLLTFRVRTCFYDVFRLDTYPIGPETLSFPVVQQIGGINAPILIPDPFPSDKKARRQTPASSEDDWRVGEVFFSPDNGFGMHKPTLSDNGLVQFHANFPIERHNYGMAFRLFPPLGLLALLTFAAYTLRPEYLGGRLLIVVSAAALTIFHQHYFLSNLQKAACLQKVYGTLYLFDAVTVLFSVGAYGLMRHNRPTAAGRLNRIGKVTHVAVGIAALSVLVYLFAGFR